MLEKIGKISKTKNEEINFITIYTQFYLTFIDRNIKFFTDIFIYLFIHLQLQKKIYLLIHGQYYIFLHLAKIVVFLLPNVFAFIQFFV